MRRVVFGALLAVYSGFLTAASIVAPSHIPEQITLSDKWMHLLAYALLSFIAYGFFISEARQKRVVALLSLIYTVCLGGFTEILQLNIAYRSFEWTDLAADTIGAVIACAVSVIIHAAQQTRFQGDGLQNPSP